MAFPISYNEFQKAVKQIKNTYTKCLLDGFEVESEIITLFLVFAYLESVSVHSMLDLITCDVVVV